MSRHAAVTLLQQQIGRSTRSLQVDMCPGYWIVTYQGRPFSLVETDQILEGRRYTRTGFSFPGFAQRLAGKLNHQFHTEDFAVLKVL